MEEEATRQDQTRLRYNISLCCCLLSNPIHQSMYLYTRTCTTRFDSDPVTPSIHSPGPNTQSGFPPVLTERVNNRPPSLHRRSSSFERRRPPPPPTPSCPPAGSRAGRCQPSTSSRWCKEVRAAAHLPQLHDGRPLPLQPGLLRALPRRRPPPALRGPDHGRAPGAARDHRLDPAGAAGRRRNGARGRPHGARQRLQALGGRPLHRWHGDAPSAALRPAHARGQPDIRLRTTILYYTIRLLSARLRVRAEKKPSERAMPSVQRPPTVRLKSLSCAVMTATRAFPSSPCRPRWTVAVASCRGPAVVGSTKRRRGEHAVEAR